MEEKKIDIYNIIYKCHLRDYFANAISHNFGEASLPRLGEKRCASELKNK